jgi:hypothetical protein
MIIGPAKVELNSRRPVNSNVMRAKSSLIACLCFFAIAHAASLYWQLRDDQGYWVRFLFGETLPMLIIAFVLPMLADFLLGATVDSRWQLVLILLAAILAFETACLFGDWAGGRFWIPWITENYGRWMREIFWRFAFPVVFVSLGALVGLLKRRRSFALRSKHA